MHAEEGPEALIAVVIKSLFGIFFDPEVGGDMFLRNVG
jgi:hypothetical protein